jgi:hypothetical protein
MTPTPHWQSLRVKTEGAGEVADPNANLDNGLANSTVSQPGVRNQQVTLGQDAPFL